MIARRSIAAAAALAACHAAPAAAAAWTQREGDVQAIVTGLYSHSGKGYDAGGKVIDIPDYEKEELYLLVEYGVSDDLTLMATPSLRHVGIEGGGMNTSGLGYTELGARYRVAHGDRWVVSVQGTARIPGERRTDRLAQVASTGAEYDMRVLAGVTFRLAGAPAFLDVQGSYRLRDGAPPDEMHADATLGIKVMPRLQLLAQSFNTVSDGAGRGVFARYRYHNAYVSAVYALSPRWSLQAGGLRTLAGRNALRERGFTAAVWCRF